MSNRASRWVGVSRYVAVSFCLAAATATAEEPSEGGGGFDLGHVQHLSEAERVAIQNEIDVNVAWLLSSGQITAPRVLDVPLQWPLQQAVGFDDFGYHGISAFVDHDPAVVDQLLDYDCGRRTYDLASGYNHQGIDFFTWPFGWIKVDDSAVEIVAAAAGNIVSKQDGNFDRSCGFGGTWNAVYVRHVDGSVAWYGHMKDGSLTSKQVGDAVTAGEYLGVVGSSGSSTGPHLHLELYDSANNLIDPYSGPCNSLNGASWWASQRPYYDSAINRLQTGFAAVDLSPPCPQPDLPNARDVFLPGDTVFFTRFYRDQLAGQDSECQVLRPDLSVFAQWTSTSSVAHYAASYWWNSYALPGNAPTGTWHFVVDYEGVHYEHPFEVTSCGNGQLDGGESCDDGNWTDCDGCSASCEVEFCGDGVACAPEQCDDGNQLPGDGCDGSCQLESCIVNNLAVVTGLSAVDAGPTSVDLSWLPSTANVDYHVNAVTSPSALLDPRQSPPGNGVLRCSATLPASGCTDTTARTALGMDLYQVLGACGTNGASEGPW